MHFSVTIADCSQGGVLRRIRDAHQHPEDLPSPVDSRTAVRFAEIAGLGKAKLEYVSDASFQAPVDLASRQRLANVLNNIASYYSQFVPRLEVRNSNVACVAVT